MCGICGYVGYTDDGSENLKKMMDAIRHRGPDSSGVYQDDEISMGFCRLAIVDVENGNQPIWNEDETRVLICNGEIYNYKKLRHTLEILGHRFRTNSDSEVILHGYEEYGKRILYQLKGMFAFVIWDRKEKVLFGARDCFGIKPLYYARINNNFVFASEIKSILCFPGYDKQLNEEALEQYLSFQYSVLEESFFKEIFQLLPGHCILFSDGKIEKRAYDCPKLNPVNTAGKESYRQYLLSLKDTLENSISNHKIGEVEIGGFLSEGVDSNYLAVQAKCGKLFTLGYYDEYKRYSEIEDAKELNTVFGFEHFKKKVSGEEFLKSVPEVTYFMDEPCGDASAITLYLIAKEASGHVKVVLSGEGADELFGGYEIYKEPDALKWMNWIPFNIRKKLAEAVRDWPDVKGRDYIIRAGTPLEERYIGNAHIFSTQERRELLKTEHYTLSESDYLKTQYKCVASLHPTEKMQQIDINNWLPGDILRKADRMSMAHSLELRVPYLDQDVFDIAGRLPRNAKIRKGKTKFIFREIAGRMLPKEIANRKKKGFPVPIREWIKEEAFEKEIRTKFTGTAAGQLFHTDQLLQLLDNHLKGYHDQSRKIWTIYMFLVWYEVYEMPVLSQ